MSLICGRCLCCFRLHPEVWLSIARYELSVPNGVVQARTVLKEALATLPQSIILWLELSELEEKYNGVDVACEVLRNAFEQIPSAFTFALLQRVVRRRDGKIAARKAFAETIALRHEGILGFEVSLLSFTHFSHSFTH
jgi:predicted Zn-dependent protease